MKNIFTILLSILSTLNYAQMNNDDFEIWDSTFTATYSSELSAIFGVSDPTGGHVANWSAGSDFGVCRTTDSYSGDYAIILHNWYGYAQEWMTYHDTLSYRPQYLQGYFKYLTGGNNLLAYGTADIALTKLNGTSIDTIATGSFQFDSTNVYTPFQIELNYLSIQNPDSIKVYFQNAYSDCGSDIICNLLYLDKLSLTDISLNLETLNALNRNFTIYPNPFSHSTTIHSTFIMNDAFVEIFNIYGQRVSQIEGVTGQEYALFRDNLPTGQYVIKITQNNKLITTNKILIID